MHRPPGGGGPRDGALELMVGDVLSRRHQFEDSVRQLEQRPLGSASSVGAPSSSATSADTTRTPSHASGPARTNPPAQHREAAQSISDQLHDPPHADGALPAIGFDADTLKALATLNEQLRLRANRALGTPDTLKQPHAKIDLTFEVYRNKGLRHGFQVGVAIVIATLLNFVDAFREPINGKAWAAITVIATYEATYGGFLRKALQRIIGTALGGAIGLLIVAVAFALPPRCFQCAYKPWMLSAALFIVTVIVSYLKLQRPRDSYVFTVMIMTVLIVVLGEYGDPSHEEDWDPAVPFYLRPFYESAIYRIGLVISGVAISFVVSTLVFPERASTRLPETIGGIMLKIADLQAFVHDSYLDVDEESFSMSAFRDKALVQADSISRDLEKLRTSVDNALGEILLSASEAQATEYAPVCIRDIERIFYLTVTMVYGRMWTDSCALHRVLNNQLAVLIEMLDTSLRATAHVFQRRLIHPRSHDIDPELFSSAMFPLLRDAVLMTLHIFQQQQAELHRSYLSLAFGEMDWTNWNHYSLSFMQCLVNLAGVIDAGIDMHDLDA
nr:hypothetical protein HK105_001304 [Polyrhizophydium stewartii]